MSDGKLVFEGTIISVHKKQRHGVVASHEFHNNAYWFIDFVFSKTR